MSFLLVAQPSKVDAGCTLETGWYLQGLHKGIKVTSNCRGYKKVLGSLGGYKTVLGIVGVIKRYQKGFGLVPDGRDSGRVTHLKTRDSMSAIIFVY